MKLEAVLGTLEELAPLAAAEAWDNVGLLVGDPGAEIRRVLVTVDYTAEVAAEARALGAGLVVSYHPPLFAAVKRAPHDALWVEAVRLGVALYSPHTALDVARGGTNDFLADACGVAGEGRRAVRLSPGATELGLGRVGPVVLDGSGVAPSRAEIAARLKEALGLRYVLVSGPRDLPARVVAVAAGAGGELLPEAMQLGADVFVTGELRHHDALLAARRGVTVVATMHSNSERAAVRAYARRLAERLGGDVVVTASEVDQDPFDLA